MAHKYYNHYSTCGPKPHSHTILRKMCCKAKLMPTDYQETKFNKGGKEKLSLCLLAAYSVEYE